MRLLKIIFIMFFLCLGAARVGAEDGYAWLYFHNWTDEDLHVYIDGKDYGVAPKGMPSWWCINEGHHQVTSYRVSNPWAGSHHCAWVGCFPKGDVTVTNHDI